MWKSFTSLVAAAALPFSAAHAVPATLSYEGRWIAAGQNPTATIHLKFALVSASGTVLWTHDGTPGLEPATALATPVERGLFAVKLGAPPATTPIPSAVLGERGTRLRVWLATDSQGPFSLFANDTVANGAAYAIRAATVDDLAIKADKLTDSAVDSQHLATAAVTASRLADGSITAAKLGDGSISTAQLADQAIGANTLATGSIAGALLAAGTSPVGSSGTVASRTAENPALAALGYQLVGTARLDEENWNTLAVAEAAERSGATLVWTGQEVLLWGGRDSQGALVPGGLRFSPASRSFSTISTSLSPSAREGHAAVWTGARMLIWGGRNDSAALADGAAYDPLTDTWSALSSTGAPSARSEHAACWTGTRLLVWGGRNSFGTPLSSGFAYDPGTGSWSALPAAPLAARRNAGHAWTGNAFILWGGRGLSGPLGDGAAYDPATQTWTLLPSSGAPSPRHSHALSWTGDRLLVWGGSNDTLALGDGTSFDPVAQIWSPLPSPNAPGPRSQPLHAFIPQAGWIVASGQRHDGTPLTSGAIYDPASDRWLPLALPTPAATSALPAIVTDTPGSAPALIAFDGPEARAFTPALTRYLFRRP
jgi:hypothetical protein